MSAQNYESIARRNGLDYETSGRFIAYMRARWADEEVLQCETGYADEWAERFAGGQEFSASDLHGQATLKRLYPERY